CPVRTARLPGHEPLIQLKTDAMHHSPSRAFRNTEHGATIIEYVLVLICIALVVFLGISSLGQKTDSNLQLLESGFSTN
ncbi:hypothetical protein ABTE60_19780, partial [Acinetobacter baumannii]